MDETICGGAMQAGVLTLRERTEAAGTAFHGEASYCWPHPVFMCLSGLIPCSAEIVPREYHS